MPDRRGDPAHRDMNDHASGPVGPCASARVEHPRIQDYAIIGDGRSIAPISIVLGHLVFGIVLGIFYVRA